MLSRTDTDEPNATMPNKERAAPRRTKLRNEIEDPKWAQSKTDIVAPRR